MSTNELNIWALLIPFMLASLAPLLPAHRYITILQEESFHTKSFLKTVNADKPYHHRKMIFWIVSMFLQLSVFIALSGALLNTDIPRTAAHAVAFDTTVLTSIATCAVWFMFRKNKLPQRKRKINARVVRIYITLGIFYIMAQLLFALLVAGLIYGWEQVTPGYRDTFAYFLYQFAVMAMIMEFNLGLSPYLLALSSAITRPLESLLEKRKINA